MWVMENRSRLGAAFRRHGRQAGAFSYHDRLAQQPSTPFRAVVALSVKVEMLSRFRNPGEQRTFLRTVRRRIDFLNRHPRLLQSDVCLRPRPVLIEKSRFV
jgi:hypothetical protein